MPSNILRREVESKTRFWTSVCLPRLLKDFEPFTKEFVKDHIRNREVQQLEIAFDTAPGSQGALCNYGYRARLRWHEEENQYIIGIKSINQKDEGTISDRHEWETRRVFDEDLRQKIAPVFTPALHTVLQAYLGNAQQQMENRYQKGAKEYERIKVIGGEIGKILRNKNLFQKFVEDVIFYLTEHAYEEQDGVLIKNHARDRHVYGTWAVELLNPYNPPAIKSDMQQLVKEMRYCLMEATPFVLSADMFPEDDKAAQSFLNNGQRALTPQSRSRVPRIFRVLKIDDRYVEVARDLVNVQAGVIRLFNSEMEIECGVKKRFETHVSFKRRSIKGEFKKRRAIVEALEEKLHHNLDARNIKYSPSQSKGDIAIRAQNWNARTNAGTLHLLGYTDNRRYLNKTAAREALFKPPAPSAGSHYFP